MEQNNQNDAQAQMTEQQQRKLQEIADQMGTTVMQLLVDSTPEEVISNYSNNTYRVLNESV